MKSPRTVLLHNAQELDNDFGAGSDEDLTFSSLLSVVDGIERIVEDTRFHHFGGFLQMRFSTRWWEVRYLYCVEKLRVSHQKP